MPTPLPEAIRETMEAANKKVEAARAIFERWDRAQPDPGYEALVSICHHRYLTFRAEALEAVRSIQDAIHTLDGSQKNFVAAWAKDAERQLPLRRHKRKHPRKPTSFRFYFIKKIT